MKTRTAMATGLLLFLVFSFGVGYLFVLRFRVGDMYPIYSSLRSDPLGTRVLYEALAEHEGLTVSRNTRHIDKVTLTPDTALFFLGDTADPDQHVARKTQRKIDAFLRKGGRCVITLFPRNFDPEEKEAWEEKMKKEDSEKEETKEDTEEEEEKDENADDKKSKAEKERDAEFKKRMIRSGEWLTFDVTDIPYTGQVTAELHSDLTNSALPHTMSCHTSRTFSDLGEGWRTIYRRDGNPVIIEKSVGHGTLVLSALSYFVSNEAMRDERYPDLLSWVVGDKTTILFDEYHHMIMESQNIATLARKYNLYWIGGVLLVLGILFIWQNASSLMPAYRSDELAELDITAEGKGSASGLINLLRSNIPTKEIVLTCVNEWKQSSPTAKAGGTASGGDPHGKLARAKQVILVNENAPLGRRNPVETYNRVKRILNERSPHGNHETERSTG